MSLKTKACLNCLYFRFVRFERWCSHVRHHRPIRKPAARCHDWVSRDDKTGGHAPKVPIGVSMGLEPGAVTYEILSDGEAIKCLVCGMVSYHRGDIRMKYCGKCHEFHSERIHLNGYHA